MNVGQQGIGLLAAQAFAGTSVDRADVWRLAAEAGADWVSVTEEAWNLSADEVVSLRKHIEASGLNVRMTACHAFALSDPRDAVREFNLEWAKCQVDFTVNLGATRMKILLGEWIWRGMWPVELQWKLEIEALKQLTQYSEKRGVTLSLEWEPRLNSFANDPASSMKIINAVDSGWLRANADISHMMVLGSQPTELNLLRGYLDSVDFSDSNALVHLHLPPNEGVGKLAEFAQVLEEIGDPNVLVAVEVGPFLPRENVRERVSDSIAATKSFFPAVRSFTAGDI